MKTLLAAVALATLPFTLQAQTFFGPTPYLQQSDSPFNSQIIAGTVLLETFEDGLFNIPGVSASDGTVIGPGGLTDSVDADDGVIDGSGTNGHSFFTLAGSITFTFSGPLPTMAGIVWTDGGGGATITFQAFDANNMLIGTLIGNHADGNVDGQTAEDRFYGVIDGIGISKISISNSVGGLEVDHLQFGAPVPEPATLTLFVCSALGAVLLFRGRAHRRIAALA